MRARVLVLFLLSLLPSVARASNPEAYVDFHYLEYVKTDSWEAPLVLPFPLDVWAAVIPQGPFTAPRDDQPLPKNYVMYAFADEKGKVRAQATTLGQINSQHGPPPGDKEFWFRTVLTWRKTYTKGASTDKARFTVNKNELLIFHPGSLGADEFTPYAGISISVDLIREDLTKGDTRHLARQLDATVELTDSPTFGCHFPQFLKPFPLFLCQSGLDSNSRFFDGDSPLHAFVAEQRFGVVGVDTVPYHGTIDLKGLAIGERYTVEYVLIAEARSSGGENVSFASVGDPLDVDSGITLEVDSPPAADDRPHGQVCDTQANVARYVDNLDGTVTDARTGLVWQRCPLGSRLDTAGTPGDPSDDRCVLASGGRRSWQAALQAAASDTTGGHGDWRLPNAKELDSIAEPGCVDPAIERRPFPDTPSTHFWTSTPGRGAGTAMALDFLGGDLVLAGVGETHALRLVRDGAAPQLLPATLSVGAPQPVIEGDTGTVDLVFPILLDRPASAPVTFQYATVDGTAQAGSDYDATSGTATIPAGESRVDIHVPVRGDLLGEANEGLFLVLDQVSAGARLGVASEEGVILDDEPALIAWPTDVYEGQSGTAALAFTVTLSRAVNTPVTFSYATSDGTATAGTDYVATSGTGTIPAGERTVLITVPVNGDTAREADETVQLTLSGASANARIGVPGATGLIIDDEVPTLAALNDTGLDVCADASHFGLACPQAGFPGQDAESGRDLAFPSDGDGRNGFVFTKLDASGAPLPDQTQGGQSCVRDEVTGLWWEVKTDDGGLRDRHWDYTWFDSSGLDDGGDRGTENRGSCFDRSHCDTEKFVAAVNAAGLCGHTDWRLPSREELFSLLDSSNGTHGFDPVFFPNRPPVFDDWWTSTPLGGELGGDPTAGLRAWRVAGAAQGTTLASPRQQPMAVRLVRGGL